MRTCAHGRAPGTAQAATPARGPAHLIAPAPATGDGSGSNTGARASSSDSTGAGYPGRRGEAAPNGRSRSWPGSRRSRRGSDSRSSVPAVSGHSTTHSQLPSTSPANAARSGASTLHSGNSWWRNRTAAWGGPAAKPSPGSGPGRPAKWAPRPTPGSSEISSISPSPPTGLGPDSATTQARVPVRSSPAPANPVTSQPTGSGQGTQTGTLALRSRPRSPSADGEYGDRSGYTSPCSAQCQPLAQGLGSVSGPPQRGQMGAIFMDTDVEGCRGARQAPGGIAA